MPEKEPLYFKEFREDINHKIETYEPKYFKEFKEHIDEKFEKVDKRFDKIEDKLDVHFETIGELKVQVTGIELMLRKKADDSYIHKIEKRVSNLEETTA